MFNSKEQREEWVSRVVHEAMNKAMAAVKRSLEEQWAEIRMQTCKKSGDGKLASSQPQRVRKEMITEILEEKEEVLEEIEEHEGKMHENSKSVLNETLGLVEREDFSGLDARAGLTVTSGGGGRSQSGPANSHSEPPGGSFERGGTNSSGSGGGPGNSASGRGKFVKGGSEASGSGGGPGGEGCVMGIRARGGELGGYVGGNISGGPSAGPGGPDSLTRSGSGGELNKGGDMQGRRLGFVGVFQKIKETERKKLEEAESFVYWENKPNSKDALNMGKLVKQQQGDFSGEFAGGGHGGVNGESGSEAREVGVVFWTVQMAEADVFDGGGIEGFFEKGGANCSGSGGGPGRVTGKNGEVCRQGGGRSSAVGEAALVEVGLRGKSIRHHQWSQEGVVISPVVLLAVGAWPEVDQE